MLLRRQGLFPAAKKHFALFRDPFADDVQFHEDVFVSLDRESHRAGNSHVLWEHQSTVLRKAGNKS